MEHYRTVDVLVGDSRTVKGRVVSSDKKLDLAVVKINGVNWPHLNITAEQPEVGDEIFILGYQLDLPGEATLTRGLVSAIRPDERFVLLQTDAAINPGSSGGAALNSNGQFIAVPTEKIIDSEGVAFLIGLFSVADEISRLSK